jgi:uncharacterized protein (DUF1330 family)
VSGYLIAAMDVEDRDAFNRYFELAGKAIEKGGFKVEGLFKEDAYLFDGALPAKRIVLMKFESADEAKRFYYSDAYKDAEGVRHASAKTAFSLVIDGELQKFG